MIKFPPLYKRSNSKDHINEWQIEVDGHMFRTTTGFVGMKMFTGDWTTCSPKNIGKKNSTTSEQQALAEAQALWQKRKDLGYWEDINDCDKKVFFQPMLAQDFDKRKNKVKYPILSQPKLDGVRCVIKSDGMWSRNGKEIISAPHIFENLKHIFDNQPDLILDGELYTSNRDVDFNTIISCVRKTKPTQADLDLSKQYIEYWMYDIINDKDQGYEERYEDLIDLKQNYKLNPLMYHVIPTYELPDEKHVMDQLSHYIEQGFEGQILRECNSFYENKRSNGLLKHKTFYDEEFEILAINEGGGKFANKAATMSFQTSKGVSFDSTINGTMEYLEEIWANKDKLIGKLATVKYFEETTDGSLRFPKVINIDRASYE
jgi:ATP-dependent DNA ligase